MICVYCSYRTTTVANTRPTKHTPPQVWRRRFCTVCKKTFTTYEYPSSSELPLVKTADEREMSYSEPRLLISIWRELTTSSQTRADDAAALASTVTQRLLSEHHTYLTPTLIATITYRALTAFEPTSGARYGLSHGLLTSNRFEQ